jgi:hypothetical protein
MRCGTAEQHPENASAHVSKFWNAAWDLLHEKEKESDLKFDGHTVALITLALVIWHQGPET